MKKFILRSSLFIAPFFTFYFFSALFYTTEKGDLLRLGYIMNNTGYDAAKVFHTELRNKTLFTRISGVNLRESNKATLLSIGDSFSELDSVSYQNYLAKNKDIKVLHYDRFLHENPIQTLESILNGDLLDKVNVKYIILESVERDFVNRAKDIDTTKVIRTDSIINYTKIHNLRKLKEDGEDDFFSKTILRFPVKTIDYQLDDNAFDSPTYMVKTTNRLFSVDQKELLFYFQDMESVSGNNNLEDIAKLNVELNNLSVKLENRGIKLIVLPCPDKYDLYYDYIVGKEKYPKPLFFDHFGKMKKQYLYVNAKDMLGSAVKLEKDIYLFDDTHWSPWAAKLIAKEIYRQIIAADRNENSRHGDSIKFNRSL